MKPKKVVLFDMDGTLLDTRQDIADSANGARRELGLAPLSIEEVVRAVGDGINPFVSRISYPVEDPRFPLAKEVFLRHYDARTLGVSKPYPGVEPLLLELCQQRDLSMAVVSNKPAHLVKKLVTHFGWDRYFPVALGGDSAPKPKPARDLIDLAILELGLHLSRDFISVWMVGDSHQDLDAATNAQVNGVWCSWGFMEHAPERSHSFTILNEPIDFLKLLDEPHQGREANSQ